MKFSQENPSLRRKFYGISAGSPVCHATFHSQGLLVFNEESSQDTIPHLYEFVIIRSKGYQVVNIMDSLLAEIDRKRKQIDQNEVTSVSIFKLELQYERNVWPKCDKFKQNQLEQDSRILHLCLQDEYVFIISIHGFVFKFSSLLTF